MTAWYHLTPKESSKSPLKKVGKTWSQTVMHLFSVCVEGGRREVPLCAMLSLIKICAVPLFLNSSLASEFPPRHHFCFSFSCIPNQNSELRFKRSSQVPEVGSLDSQKPFVSLSGGRITVRDEAPCRVHLIPILSVYGLG